MADTTDPTRCAGDAPLPTSPFYALHYHFGMLLGVEDCDTEQAYHRGKSRLHNAWLHRDGVVWGLAVRLDAAHDEIRVTRGLALDGAGRELHLDEEVCLSVPAWLAALPEQERIDLAGEDGTQAFDAHVTIRHRACLTRPVPALMETCEGSARDTAYSRDFETVEVRLVPGLAPAPPAPSNHRVRLLLGLAPARTTPADTPSAADEDAQILTARDALLAQPREQRLTLALALLRRCAARDTAELTPPMRADGDDGLLFPAADDAALVLANLHGLALAQSGDGLHLKTSGSLDDGPRPAHLDTRTIQELAVAAFFCCAGAGTDGPQADPQTLSIKDKTVSFQVDRPLHPDTVQTAAFAVSALVGGTGWKALEVSKAAFTESDLTVTLTLSDAIAGTAVRLIAQGTGPTPLLGKDLKPLAGAIGDPPTPAGRDFVHLLQIGS